MTNPIDADAFNRFEAESWNRAAQDYDAFFTPITSRVADALLDATATAEGTRLLDVACGPGAATRRAADRGAAATGIDVSAAMIDLASRAHPDCSFTIGSAEELPFEAGSFDAAIVSFGVLHVGRPGRLASEIARVLVPGGRAALTVWDKPDRSPLLGLLVEAVARAGVGAPGTIPRGPDFFRYADDEAFAALLRGAGFRDVEVRTITFTHELADPGELWDGLLRATVRTAPLVLSQEQRTRTRIRRLFDRAARKYLTGEGLKLPVRVKLASGRCAPGRSAGA